MPALPRVHPLHALAVYAEPLSFERRVALLGDAVPGLQERLEQLGARQVVVADSPHEVEGLRGRTFDLVIVPDLGMFDDAERLLAQVGRMVGDAGAALIVASNRDAAEAPAQGSRAFDYYALFDLVARQFTEVRMIAQMPFCGLALAELGEGDESPPVSVDTQLAEGRRAPQAFVALASRRAVRLDPYALIELPSVDVPWSDQTVLDPSESRAAQAELAQERLRAQALAAQNDDLRARVRRIPELERAADDFSRRVAELSDEVARARSDEAGHRVTAAQVEELSSRAARAERGLASAESDLARVAEAQAAELLRYEEALRDRAHAVQALEEEVQRRERMVQELVGALEEQAARPTRVEVAAPTAPPPTPAAPPAAAPAVVLSASAQSAIAEENAKLRDRLDDLALDLARRQDEVQAAAWRVQELERQLAQAQPSNGAQARAQPGAAPPVAPTDADRKLTTALDEVDALRRALAQEHEARVLAESGEELTRARAEIERQAALLQQLGRDEGPSHNGSGELR